MPQRKTTSQTQNTLSDHTKDRTGHAGSAHDNLLVAALNAYTEANFPPGSPGARAAAKLASRNGL